jgi:hypothetical protein
MTKTKRRKRKAFEAVADAATVTLTAGEATALISGIGVAIKYEEVPEDIAPHLARALEKFDVAFGFGITPQEYD